MHVHIHRYTYMHTPHTHRYTPRMHVGTHTFMYTNTSQTYTTSLVPRARRILFPHAATSQHYCSLCPSSSRGSRRLRAWGHQGLVWKPFFVAGWRPPSDFPSGLQSALASTHPTSRMLPAQMPRFSFDHDIMSFIKL